MTFYALLIGIDYYESNPYYNSLRGAVRDIDKVADYLEKSLQIPTQQITRLTSPLPDTNSLADVRSARRELPPTYQNIVQSFNDITENAQAQDLVYIHYSGHGGRVKTIFPDFKGEGLFDEGLVPMDVGDNGRYLRDVEVATLLKRMTDKGLIVTIIFDSCHSGGATRGDGDIRGSRNGEPDTQERPFDSLVATREDLVQNWRFLTQGDSREGWLPTQRDYVFLGACRPSEYAYESAFNGKDRNGALTYWMLDTFNTVPTGLTYQALYDRVKGQIQSKFPNQLPMLLGEGDRLVFGSEIQPVQYSLTVINVASVQGTLEVTLDGGLAQGLSRGTRFALYPVGSDFTDKQQRMAVVEITELQASTATAKILTMEESGVSAVIEDIQPGLPAVMESAPLTLKHPVRLFIKEVGNGENQLPFKLAEQQAAALKRLRQAMEGNGWLREVQGDEESHYQVAVNRNGEYEICMGTPIQNLTPALSVNDVHSPDKVVERLIHLGKYQSVQQLDNPASSLASFLEFQLLDLNKNPFPDISRIVLKQNDIVFLRVKNNSSQPLNIAILDLDSTWEISQIPIQNQLAYFYELGILQEVEIEIEGFSFPEREGYKQAKEIFKLLATRGAANFQWLILPSLDQQIQNRGNLNQELEIQMEEMRGRGLASSINPLNNLLTSIGSDINNPPLVSRKAIVRNNPNADWVTKQIQITVER
jgi:hypothetical protein